MIIFDEVNKNIFLRNRNKYDRFYVAYGANTNPISMFKRCGDDAECLCICILKDYELSFSGMGHCNVTRKEGSQTVCALWGINLEVEQQLDIYEGYPTYYDKKNMIIDIYGPEAYALIYVMLSEFEARPATPMDSYVQMVRHGYVQVGIPENQLDEALERVISCFCQQ
jgi:gamma-glutamylcyclotransferase (GGCT)/AIG2-like uncharacterized protein YtfP